ncbi:hypothetical protein AMJ85_11935 [candidate division BRC1 bacterium SM23_51]|nr:MAG: hypothetical protein AMJ85_11935 [candidate division BRC1 bacterium SM23_51]
MNDPKTDVLKTWGKFAESQAQQAALRAYAVNGGTYPHGFAIPGVSADDFAKQHAEFAPAGWTVRATEFGRGTAALDAMAFRIGQYKARTGDPESPIYMCPTSGIL